MDLRGVYSPFGLSSPAEKTSGAKNATEIVRPGIVKKIPDTVTLDRRLKVLAKRLQSNIPRHLLSFLSLQFMYRL
jgi:hypothetical protein